jgi:ribosomal protein S27AE
MNDFIKNQKEVTDDLVSNIRRAAEHVASHCTIDIGDEERTVIACPICEKVFSPFGRVPWNKGLKGIPANNKRERNGNWQGDKVGYAGIHRWVTTNKQKPETCEICGEKKKLELSNISQEYKRDLSDWRWICRRCHMRSDGRMKNLKHYKDYVEHDAEFCPECGGNIVDTGDALVCGGCGLTAC